MFEVVYNLFVVLLVKLLSVFIDIRYVSLTLQPTKRIMRWFSYNVLLKLSNFI
jgi:hypothetical protein